MKDKNEQKIKELEEKLEKELQFQADETANAADAQANSGETDALSKDDEFKKLIKGEFKSQFEKRMKENLKRRFKELSSLKEKAQQGDEIIGAVMKKYGIENFDRDAILNAIGEIPSVENTDKSEIERVKELELECELMKKKNDALTMDQTVKEWIKDGEYLKETYPDFSLEDETSNPEFIKLLKSGIGLKNAYLAMHHNSIVKDLVAKAVKDAQDKTIESIRLRNQRPLENGTGSKSTALFKTDVSKLTPLQRAEIAKRVSRGEIISF